MHPIILITLGLNRPRVRRVNLRKSTNKGNECSQKPSLKKVVWMGYSLGPSLYSSSNGFSFFLRFLQLNSSGIYLVVNYTCWASEIKARLLITTDLKKTKHTYGLKIEEK